MAALDRLRFGVLSTASICAKVIPALQEAGEVVCVGEEFGRGLLGAVDLAANFDIPHAYGSYMEVIQDPRVQAVYIPLPTGLKSKWVKAAAQHKKHVLCEKPLPSIAVLDEMLEVCDANGVVWMDGTMWLHSKRTPQILEEVQKIDVMRIDAGFTHAMDITGNIRENPELEPLGMLGDCGWYPISASLAVMDWKMPSEIHVHQSQVEKGVFKSVAGVLKWDNGVISTFACGCGMSHRSYLTASGQTGAVYVEDLVGGQGKDMKFDTYFEPFVGGRQFRVNNVEGAETIMNATECNHTVEMAKTFVELVRNGDLQCWPQRSRSIQCVLDGIAAVIRCKAYAAVLRSSSTGSWQIIGAAGGA